jgi:hypothetical protein
MGPLAGGVHAPPLLALGSVENNISASVPAVDEWALCECNPVRGTGPKRIRNGFRADLVVGGSLV